MIETSPFLQALSLYKSKGYNIIPVKYGDKMPLVKNWSKLSYTKLPKAKLDIWLESFQEANVGIVLGPSSGLIGIDFDYDHDNLHAVIREYLGDTIIIEKTGGKGSTVLYRYNGEDSQAWSKDGEVVVEILSTGKQTVMPPSLHPSGKNYTYTGVSLDEVDHDSIPFLPEDFINKVNALFRTKLHEPSYGGSLKTKQIEGALKYIPADDYGVWLAVGMALKNEYGDEGFDLWDNWSQKAGNYDPNLNKKWESFNKDGVGIGTIIKYAKDHGYDTNELRDSEYYTVDIDTAFDKIISWRDGKYPKGTDIRVPGLKELLHFRPDEFTVVTARPEAGKSEFIDYLCFKMSEDYRLKTCFLSMENDYEEHMESFVHRFLQKPIEEASIDEIMGAKKKVSENFSWFDYLTHGTSIDKVLEVATNIQSKRGLDILVIDPFMYVTSPVKDSIHAHAEYCCMKIRKFCKKFNIHVILIAHPRTQFSFKGEPPKLDLYSISGGASFYNACDNGLILARSGDILNGEVAKVKKQRTDKKGKFQLMFNWKTRSFGVPLL